VIEASSQSESSAWKNYWREDRLAACMPDDPAASATIERHWRAFFESLEPGSRLLDVATGNGVLLVWAAQAAPDSGLQSVGVDLADIDPQRFLPQHRDLLQGVRFLGNTAAEALPFENGEFDVLISQYGIEYAELDAAMSEAARVLRPGGQLYCLAHSGNSSIAAQGRRQLREIDLLLDAEGPFTRMAEFLQAQSRGVKVKRATRRLTETLREAQNYCDAHPDAVLLRQLCGGILDTANNLPRYRPQDVERWLEDNRGRLESQRQRIRDLRRARLDAARLDTLRGLLGQAPWHEFSMELLTDEERGVELGLLVHARRA
jgi:ubiquinone/menaquinone biosynthesis C-methylase UbiE